MLSEDRLIAEQHRADREAATKIEDRLGAAYHALRLILGAVYADQGVSQRTMTIISDQYAVAATQIDLSRSTLSERAVCWGRLERKHNRLADRAEEKEQQWADDMSAAEAECRRQMDLERDYLEAAE